MTFPNHVKEWLGFTDHLDMTITVDWDVKPIKQKIFTLITYKLHEIKLVNPFHSDGFPRHVELVWNCSFSILRVTGNNI